MFLFMGDNFIFESSLMSIILLIHSLNIFRTVGKTERMPL